MRTTHRALLAAAVLAAAVLTAALGGAPARAGHAAGSKPPAPLVFTGWTAHAFPSLGVAFDLPEDPAAPLTVAERTYPYAERGVEFEVEVAVADGRVRLWRFRDVEGRALEDWFDAHFGFLVDARALVWSDTVGAGAPAVIVHQPTSPHVAARETTVTRVGGWTLVVTCERVDDEDGRRLCDAIVDTLRPLAPAVPSPAAPVEAGGEVAP